MEYTTEQYEKLRKIAFQIKELTQLNGLDVDQVFSDLQDIVVNEDWDEF